MNEVALWPLCLLRASEQVCNDHVAKLADRIARCGLWTHPIPVHLETGLVMDGNHRRRAAELLQLHQVPVVPLSYSSPRVVVKNRADNSLFDVTSLLGLTHTGTLLPYKTTAHYFEPALPVVAIPLVGLLKDPRR